MCQILYGRRVTEHAPERFNMLVCGTVKAILRNDARRQTVAVTYTNGFMYLRCCTDSNL
jgi:hypothetical protein